MTVSSPLLFILGTQRAGTTLLTRALSAHKDLFIQNEISVEQVFPEKIDASAMLDAMDTQILKRHKQNINQIMLSQKKQYWGIKDPELTDHLSALEKFSTLSKFIIIVRDARGVVNSYIDNRWGLGTNAYTGAKRWKMEVDKQIAFAKKFPEQTLVIRFEDFISDMEHSLRQICFHLDIVFDETMLKYNKKEAQFKENASNINTKKPPDLRLATKWENKLSSRQIGIINFVAQDTLKSQGYDLSIPPLKPSFYESLYYKMHQQIVGELQLQWQWRKARYKSFKKNSKQPSIRIK
ncbi:sulfotransferase [Paraglaciecola sp. 25GB23A]|uniref:sulfotransferase family protein n=1 Tax=Paraglaciecola sp. 25GB23A TaxID=3156068 RepID=UPI0032AF93A3